MAYGLNWQELYDKGDYNDTLKPDEEDFTFEKSGNTKTIAGHLCEEYLGETDRQHKMSVRFDSGWNELKIVDDIGGEDSKRVFAVVKD